MIDVQFKNLRLDRMFYAVWRGKDRRSKASIASRKNILRNWSGYLSNAILGEWK